MRRRCDGPEAGVAHFRAVATWRGKAMPVDVPAELSGRARAYLIEHPNATCYAAVKAVMAGER